MTGPVAPAAALVAFAPYALEAADLVASWITALLSDKDGELTEEQLAELRAKFEASQARRDVAIQALDEAIAAKRAGIT